MTNRKLSIHVILCISLCILVVLKYLVQLIVPLVPFMIEMSGFGQDASSIGVIAGAEGPTAIFVTVSN